MSFNDDRTSYAAHGAYFAESTPCNELGFVICRDFVWQQLDSIGLQGTVRDINSIMEKVNLGFIVRPTSNSDSLSAVHALTISLETTNPDTPITFNNLQDILKSGAYENLAATTVKNYPMPSEQRKELYQRITAAKDLPLTAMLVLLNLLGRFSGQVYELGVLTFEGILNNIQTFRLQLHSTNPKARATKTIWIAKDCFCTQSNVTKPQWSGIAPIPIREATTTNAETCPLVTNLPRTAVDDQEDDDDITDYDLEGLQQLHNRGRDSRRTIRGAPPRNTRLPIEMLSDATLEELLIYYPEHVLHWPGLALVALHTCIRSKVKGATGFKYISDLINGSRLLHKQGEDSNLVTVSRISIGFWLKEAAKTLLGSHYSTKEEIHMECLYKAIAKDPKVQNVAEFLQKHLWDSPTEDKIAGLYPPEPLYAVRESVINHPEHGTFKDLVLRAVADMNVSAPQLSSGSHLHPIILKLNDFTQSSADLQTASAAGTIKPTSHAIPRDRYPTHVSQEDMINKFWPDLYGEPLLWTHLRYSMADIAKRVSEEAYRTYSRTRSQFEIALRQRKRTALKDRADRLHRPLSEILSEYGRETTDFGARKGRKGRAGGLQAQETEVNYQEGAMCLASQHKLKRKRERNTDDGEPRRRRQRLPSLPPLSPPALEEEWEFPPESEFRLTSKPGRYIGVKRDVSKVELIAVTDSAAPATHLAHSSSDTQMGFGSSYEVDNDFDFEQIIITALNGYDESDPTGGH